MQSRVREIRQALGLKQNEFAERLGMTQAGLSSIELGKNTLTEHNIKIICSFFDVSETWLRTGMGAMFVLKSPIFESKTDQEFFALYMGLLPETKEVLMSTARSLLTSQVKLLQKQAAL